MEPGAWVFAMQITDSVKPSEACPKRPINHPWNRLLARHYCGMSSGHCFVFNFEKPRSQQLEICRLTIYVWMEQSLEKN